MSRSAFTDADIEGALLRAGGVALDAAALLAESGRPCTRELIATAISRSPRLQEAQRQSAALKM